MTDDQTLGSYTPRAMPFTRGLFAEQGTEFVNGFAAPPLCCPARAAFLTGQYPHNNGVDANAPGYPLLRDKENVLPTWLQAAGYRTGFAGKYLNGYDLVGGTDPAPGWDEWFGVVSYPAYFDYEVSENGEVRRFGDAPSDYSSRVLTDEAIEFAAEAGAESTPFFLWLAYNAPHIAAPRDDGPCAGTLPQPPRPAAFREVAGEPLPRGASFDEPDLADKPAFLRDRKPLDRRLIGELTLRWRCTLASLRAADKEIERLVDALSESGAWDETILVFLSDNGYFFGEHRLDDDKRLPYEPSLHVPLAIRVPPALVPGERVTSVDQPATLIDLAPTLLDYAGAKPCGEGGCRRLDGRSLRPLLDGEPGSWPEDRAILSELDDGFTYQALRTKRYLYSEMSADRSGPLRRPAIELYDMARDPDQLDNLWRTERSAVREIQEQMAVRLDSLRTCRGAAAEDGPRSRGCE
jgi:N-acetylglucosamine-6-sulfatase